MNTNLELDIEAFKLHPAYFSLEEKEYAQITVSFYPTSYGLHVENLYILCNNNSMEKVEIIGDAVLFEKNLIKVHVSFNNYPKCCFATPSRRILMTFLNLSVNSFWKSRSFKIISLA